MIIDEENKIKVIIASKQLLYRLGIKTIINVIGVDPKLYETDSFNATQNCMNTIPDIDFLILSEDIIEHDRENLLMELRVICPKCKLMLINNNSLRYTSCINCDFCSIDIHSSKEMIETFQFFFFELNSKKEDETSLLSDRETEILKAIAQGYSNKEIADNLSISINTVITHRKNITDKLNIKTIPGLTVYAIMHNIIRFNDVKSL